MYVWNRFIQRDQYDHHTKYKCRSQHHFLKTYKVHNYTRFHAAAVLHRGLGWTGRRFELLRVQYPDDHRLRGQTVALGSCTETDFTYCSHGDRVLLFPLLLALQQSSWPEFFEIWHDIVTDGSAPAEASDALPRQYHRGFQFASNIFWLEDFICECLFWNLKLTGNYFKWQTKFNKLHSVCPGLYWIRMLGSSSAAAGVAATRLLKVMLLATLA